MKQLTFEKTLCFYDSPQVIELRDVYGGSYVAVLVDDDRYVATGVSRESLRTFLEGAVDLRTLMLEHGEREWYLSNAAIDFAQSMQFELQQGFLSATGFLPEDGFTLHNASAAADVLTQARARDSLGLRRNTSLSNAKTPELPTKLREKIESLKRNEKSGEMMEVVVQLLEWRELSLSELADFLGPTQDQLLQTCINGLIKADVVRLTIPDSIDAQKPTVKCE